MKTQTTYKGKNIQCKTIMVVQTYRAKIEINFSRKCMTPKCKRCFTKFCVSVITEMNSKFNLNVHIFELFTIKE